MYGRTRLKLEKLIGFEFYHFQCKSKTLTIICYEESFLKFELGVAQ